jgi:hypothetical protein
MQYRTKINIYFAIPCGKMKQAFKRIVRLIQILKAEQFIFN